MEGLQSGIRKFSFGIGKEYSARVLFRDSGRITEIARVYCLET
jgi:hypothetical protein